MNGPTRRVALVMLAGFSALLLTVTWVQAIAAETYRDDPRNARTALSEAGKERGLIVAADGTVLAESVPDPDDPQRFQRRYPEGPPFAHAVGYTSLAFGADGVEQVRADDLRSRRDITLSDLIDALLGRDLRPSNVQIAIDPELQRVAFDSLGDQRGAVLAVQPQTGEVLALVSTPSFDPNLFVGPDAVVAREELLADPANPLLDRATGESYTPGSSFKPVVTAASLDSGFAGPEDTFPDPIELDLPGSTATISNADGEVCNDGVSVTIREGFRKSCNTTFAQMAMDMGSDTVTAQAEAFGFNQIIPFDWEPLESSYPNPGDDLAALAQSAIGQRDVQAVALQMALVASGIANQGQIMEPHLVARVVDADGDVNEEVEPAVWMRALSPASAAIISDLMEQVVASGTGTAATVPGFRVAGKTGTDEAPEGGAPDVWFIGFAPVENPTIALAVVVEDGGDAGQNASGGSVAAPIAQRVLATWLERGS